MSGKSDQKANVLKGQAERFSRNGEFYEALLKINKSLCVAISPKIIGELYAIRAGFYFQLQLYQKCLNNVKLARKYSCDHKSLNDLEQQSLAKILENSKLDDNPWEFFKLSHPSNPRLPYVIDSLEVRCDKKFGRLIVTNQPLSVGDVIAIEKPFMKILKSDPDDAEYPQSNSYSYCANCLADNLMDLMPCGTCSTTMFCSLACKEKADKSFHNYECRIMTELIATAEWRMPIRSFFDALSICDGSIETLEKITKHCDELKSTVFNFNLSDENDSDYDKNRLRCLLSLTHDIEVEEKDFKIIFQSHPHLKQIWSTHSKFIKNLIDRLMKIEILNFHAIKGSSLSKNKNYRAALGDGAFIFCSLVNHSCVPNVMRVVVDGQMVMIAERPIKQGEQLFDCYIGESFYSKTKTSRHEELVDYQFICECDACANNYPSIMTDELKIVDKCLFNMAEKYYNELRDPRQEPLTHKKAKSLFTNLSKKLQKNYREEFYPSREMVMLQLCIIKCLLCACKSTVSFP